jgi:uncharacterized membrane protein YtjA (UPF0391 family)
MLEAAIFFLVVALIAGLLGFTNVAAGAATIAKSLFFIFIALFLLLLLLGFLGVAAIF